MFGAVGCGRQGTVRLGKDRRGKVSYGTEGEAWKNQKGEKNGIQIRMEN